MLKRMLFVLAKQYKSEANLWLKALGRKENVAVCFIPKSDCIIRLDQLVKDKEIIQILPSSYRYTFQIINFKQPQIENSESLYIQLANHLNASHILNKSLSFTEWMEYFKSQNTILILVIPEAEELLSPINRHILTLLSNLFDEYYPYIRILSAFESHITHSRTLNYLPSSTRLYANVFTYPLYGTADTNLFIDVLEKMFEVKVSEKQRIEIINLCGGHWWFVKEAVRQISAQGKWVIDSEGIQFRLRMFLASFSDFETSLFKKLIYDKSDFSPEEKESISFYQNMHFIDSKNQMSIPIFTNFLKKEMEQSIKIKFEDNKMFINQVPVDSFFSKKERRILSLLLKHSNILVTRDQIAESIWPEDTQEHYSDWAIDQLITRLRKRLAKLSISSSRLKLVRGKGYIFRNI